MGDSVARDEVAHPRRLGEEEPGKKSGRVAMAAAIVAKIDDQSVGRGKHRDRGLEDRPGIARRGEAIDPEIADIAVEPLGALHAVIDQRQILLPGLVGSGRRRHRERPGPDEIIDEEMRIGGDCAQILGELRGELPAAGDGVVAARAPFALQRPGDPLAFRHGEMLLANGGEQVADREIPVAIRDDDVRPVVGRLRGGAARMSRRAGEMARRSRLRARKRRRSSSFHDSFRGWDGPARRRPG